MDMQKAKTKKNARASWSGDEIKLLKRLFPCGRAREIAEQIGRPVPATRLKIIRLGLKKRLRYEERQRVVNGVREKSCSKCGKWKSESQFSKDRDSKDGLTGWCKECSNMARRKQWPNAKN